MLHHTLNFGLVAGERSVSASTLKTEAQITSRMAEEMTNSRQAETGVIRRPARGSPPIDISENFIGLPSPVWTEYGCEVHHFVQRSLVVSGIVRNRWA